MPTPSFITATGEFHFVSYNPKDFFFCPSVLVRFKDDWYPDGTAGIEAAKSKAFAWFGLIKQPLTASKEAELILIIDVHELDAWDGKLAVSSMHSTP